MLVLSRKKGEQVVIGTGDLAIRVEVVEIGKGRIKLGISAPEDVAIHRQEVWQTLNQWQVETVPIRHDEAKPEASAPAVPRRWCS